MIWYLLIWNRSINRHMMIFPKMWVNTVHAVLNSYTRLQFSCQIKCGLRSKSCQIQRRRGGAQKSWWQRMICTLTKARTCYLATIYGAMCKHFLKRVFRKAPWQDECITFQFISGHLAQRNASMAKTSPASKTQSQLYVCCTLETEDKPSRQSSLCAMQFNGVSVSVMCLQTKYHLLLTSASRLPAASSPSQERKLVA